jgi:two-component system response regulator FixJ
MNYTNRIVVLDDDSRRRAAICRMLAEQGRHAEPFETLEELSASWPKSGTILIRDNGAALANLMDHMGHAATWLPVIVYADEPDPQIVVEAMLSGAIDFLAWPFSQAEVADSMLRIQARAAKIGLVKLREVHSRNRISRLTRREREVLFSVSDGLSNRSIAERLSISPRTVEIHRANMLDKLGASHTNEAIRIAIEATL